MSRRVLFYVQHLLGIGHLKRAATIARAMAAQGLGVTVVSGGMAVPGLDLGAATLIQLPGTRATDLYFKKLVDENDAPIDDAWRQRRRELLVDIFARVRPHVVALELFPFGRRQMRFELVPLLDAATTARARPRIVSSVRDILVGQHKPERNEEMRALVDRYVDYVLVHGDPAFISFAATFPLANAIANKIRYTGYVVDRSGRGPTNVGQGAGEVIVSAGGGAVGVQLLETAIAARAQSQLADRRWRILVGVHLPDADYGRLERLAASDDIVVERGRKDFPALLANAELSISQGGYNTVMETLEARVRAVIVPYAGGIETEQTVRVRALAGRTSLEIVDETALTPATLAAAVDRAHAKPGPGNQTLATRGDALTAALVCQWAGTVPW
ncbi:MAG: glycosyl transferase [Alphaproteobacteria bacterium]|nr:glycosyl transferase [Alphaproteobacteria bacterium]